MSLAGTWRLCLDPQDRGVLQAWFTAPLPGHDYITLPGTTDLTRYGYTLDTADVLVARLRPGLFTRPGPARSAHTNPPGKS